MSNVSADELWSARPWTDRHTQDICPSANSDGIIRSSSSLIHHEQMGYA